MQKNNNAGAHTACVKELRPEVLGLVKAKGFSDFTKVQRAAFPVILEGGDALVIAPTGYGKTEAAVLPMLSRLLDLRDAGEREGVQALYITPLRSLNRDMLERLTFWCKLLGLSVGVRHGDTKQSERQKQRDLPPDVLVTTPETLQSMLVAPKLKDALANVRFVVVDEVHELADSKRGVQLSLGLARLRIKSPSFQTVGLSATVGNKAQVAAFLSPSCGVVEEEIGRQLDIKVESPQVASEEYRELGLRDESKAALGRLVELIEKTGRALIFANTRFTAETLGHLLSQTRVANAIAVHHSSLAKEARLETEAEFKKDASKLKAVVCTSSLELGIDIGEVDLVVQFNSPRQVSRLLQRVGRSGHRRHLVPRGVVLAGSEMDALEALVVKERALAGLLEPAEIPSNCLDVAGHQLAGLAMDLGGVTLEGALKVFHKAYPFRTLKIEDLHSAAHQMADANCFFFADGKVTPNRRTLMYYYEGLSTIRDVKKKWVRNALDGKNVGLLDDDFVAEYLQCGVTFITRGKAWRVIALSDGEVSVEPSQDLTAAVPEWIGEEIPVALEVARGVEAAFKKPPRESKALDSRVDAFIASQAKFFKPEKGRVFVEEGERFVAIHSFYGLKANAALCRALGFLLASSQGEPVRAKASAYGVILEFHKRVSASKVVQLLQSLDAARLRSVLSTNLPNTQLYLRRLLGVARAMGIVSRDADFREFGLKRLGHALAGTAAAAEAMREVETHEMDAPLLGKLLGESRFEEAQVREGASPLAAQFFDFGTFGELVVPGAPADKLVQIFSENLLDKHAGLYCLYCGKTHSHVLREFEEKPRCPYCNSTQLTFKENKRIVEKRKEGKRLTDDELKELNEAYRVASIVGASGRRALLALKTFGVGPETAARLLQRAPKDDKEFYSSLLEAQKTFIRTRQFWRI
ncbi:hypothetical protein COX86_03575 [Candidatus Micrarchaeota archaeon CG_4_10_14_0_2_um_filter_60_11]|nr:MAG: hypothetical protein AUJ16_03105 [Candidatus Micrarchaeota archaeon CG1_02_60_51]PIN96428.1 MAG: hypothetical protein COU39_01255 [Candidatus Micrarchaeota archaeon CG10_big_fil_rev_8_21_14_0_10_60_32]PIY91933.1 MAG: hypothetical protein COY71_00510 [Candidatus Micrarchaeota archaeon CG_4_10_14_0_8_um_filter_60_7]PIZ90709.1 MAG: hypothetical protein COX86_03575 [Candidatus Micrarchaeota archaeon CG_4_10_14_0_2_um_filter_60_11]